MNNFNFGQGSDRWVTYGGKFVARFKYMNAFRSAKHFVSFLIKHFTVEEYFQKLEVERIAPFYILEEKGYECYNVLKNRKIENKLVRNY